MEIRVTDGETSVIRNLKCADEKGNDISLDVFKDRMTKAEREYNFEIVWELNRFSGKKECIYKCSSHCFDYFQGLFNDYEACLKKQALIKEKFGGEVVKKAILSAYLSSQSCLSKHIWALNVNLDDIK